MSDSITIKEGGTSRAFGPVSRLRVLKQGTGTEDFVPESGTTLTTKSVTENGIYPATQDNAYGYSQVSVNCSQEADSLTGKKQDGNEYTVSKDGSGNIQEDKVPSALMIALAPLKNAYNDGETIDLTGIVAVAVDGNDQPWTGGGIYPDGIIPASELILPVNTAHYDEGYGNVYYATSDLATTAVQQPIVCGEARVDEVWQGYAEIGHPELDGLTAYYICSPTRNAFIRSNNTVLILIASYENGPFKGIYYSVYGESVIFTTNKGNRYTYGGKTVYYVTAGIPSNDSGRRIQTYSMPVNNASNTDYGPVAWSMLYGDLQLAPTQQDVAVQWRRPGDGKTLSDEFAILVSKTE